MQNLPVKLFLCILYRIFEKNALYANVSINFLNTFTKISHQNDLTIQLLNFRSYPIFSNLLHKNEIGTAKQF